MSGGCGRGHSDRWGMCLCSAFVAHVKMWWVVFRCGSAASERLQVDKALDNITAGAFSPLKVMQPALVRCLAP